jgi:hypothetical protein
VSKSQETCHSWKYFAKVSVFLKKMYCQLWLWARKKEERFYSVVAEVL